VPTCAQQQRWLVCGRRRGQRAPGWFDAASGWHDVWCMVMRLCWPLGGQLARLQLTESTAHVCD
jgi:hypothetical protein